MMNAFVNLSMVFNDHEQFQGCLAIFGLFCLGIFSIMLPRKPTFLRRLISSNSFWTWLKCSLGIFRFVEAPANVACVLATCLRLAILAATSTDVRLVQSQWLVVLLCLVVMVLISNSLQKERELLTL